MAAIISWGRVRTPSCEGAPSSHMPRDKIPPMRKSLFGKLVFVFAGFCLASFLLYQVPAVNHRLAWRLDIATTAIRRALNPVQGVPTAIPDPIRLRAVSAAEATAPTPTGIPTLTPTLPGPTHTPVPTATPLPDSVSLDTPAWEKQDWNNCGPATLAQYLRFYGWEGDQYAISDLLKPDRGDRNVNVDELVYYVRTRAGWLNAEFRVGGDIDLLKRFIAAGIPIIVEEGYYLETDYLLNDDRWAGHYLLLNGYDDSTRTFNAQDSFIGPDRQIQYETLDESWQAFNRVYIAVYPPSLEATVKSLLGPHWDVDFNRRHALDIAQTEIETDPENAFAWFNLGSNYVYFERYEDAVEAYDTARDLGLPQRMLRYQFGPFFAYFHSGNTDELLALAEYALIITDKSEEAWLWQGWGHYRLGDTAAAIADFRSALQVNPNYPDAQYALEFVQANP